MDGHSMALRREGPNARNLPLELGTHALKSTNLFRRSWAPAESSKMETPADARSLVEQPLKGAAHRLPNAPSNTSFPLDFLEHDPLSRRLPGIPQEWHIVLKIGDVRTLFEAIYSELGRYGLARIPANAFSCNTEVINRSSSYIRILIRSYLEAISPKSTRLSLLTFQKYVSEGEPTDLAIVLRWGLGHLGRREGNYCYRGLLSWRVYEEWRRKDRTNKYLGDFDSLASSLPDQTSTIFRDIIKFLARTARASRSNNLTPEILSGLFGVLVFGPGLVDPVHESPRLETYYKRYMRSARALQRVLQLYMREEVTKGKPELNPFHGTVHMERTAFVETMDEREFPRTGMKTVSVNHLPPKNFNVRACIPDDATLASTPNQPNENANISDLQWADFSVKGFGGAVDGVGELGELAVNLGGRPIASKTKGPNRPPLPFGRVDTAPDNGTDPGPERDWAAAYSADVALANKAPSNAVGTLQNGKRYEFEDGFVDCFMLLGADWFDRADCIFDNVPRRPEPIKLQKWKKGNSWKSWMGRTLTLSPKKSTTF